MCCEETPAVPKPEENEFTKTLAEIMRERQANARKFQPLEDRLIERTEEFGSSEYLRGEQGKALGDVESSFANAKASSDADLASMGVNPNSSAFANRNLKLTLGKSLARTGALARTNDNVRRLSFDTLAGISGRGDAKVGQAIGAAQSGANAYNQGQANAIQAGAQKDDGMSGIGSLIGTVAPLMMMSSRRLKRGVKEPGNAMRRLNDMPAKEWKYKEGGPDNDTHVGPMAEDAAEAMDGDGVTLNIGDLAGTTAAAVQQMDKRVRRLENRK